MKKGIISGVIIIVVAICFALQGQGFGASPVENYKWYCAQCHGLNGKGDGPNATKEQPVTPRDHTDTKGMSKLTDADIENVIRDGGKATGKSTMMPPWSKTMTETEIKELVKYLRQLCKC
jgi:mono/diheme cytochrome c family protein